MCIIRTKVGKYIAWIRQYNRNGRPSARTSYWRFETQQLRWNLFPSSSIARLRVDFSESSALENGLWLRGVLYHLCLACNRLISHPHHTTNTPITLFKISCVCGLCGLDSFFKKLAVCCATVRLHEDNKYPSDINGVSSAWLRSWPRQYWVRRVGFHEAISLSVRTTNHRNTVITRPHDPTARARARYFCPDEQSSGSYVCYLFGDTTVKIRLCLRYAVGGVLS